VMLNVWWDMLVMWMRTRKRCVARVCLGIIPIELLIIAPGFISVLLYHDCTAIKRQTLPDYDAVSTCKSDLARQGCHACAAPCDNQCGVDDRCNIMREAIDKLLVIMQGLEGIHDVPSA